GSYYTPAGLVRELVRAALEATLVNRFGLGGLAAERWVYHGEPPPPPVRPSGLSRLTVLDPAVGSGAFLLGALEELPALPQAVGERQPRRARTAGDGAPHTLRPGRTRQAPGARRARAG